MAHFRNLSLHQKRWLECAASSISIELSPPILIQLLDRHDMCWINIYYQENELHRWVSCLWQEVKRKWGWSEEREKRKETKLGQSSVTRAEPKKWPKWVRGWYGNICWRTLPRRHRERRLPLKWVWRGKYRIKHEYFRSVALYSDQNETHFRWPIHSAPSADLLAWSGEYDMVKNASFLMAAK